MDSIFVVVASAADAAEDEANDKSLLRMLPAFFGFPRSWPKNCTAKHIINKKSDTHRAQVGDEVNADFFRRGERGL